MEYQDILESLNLTSHEAKIYLELLKLGPSKVNELAKRMNLPRTTIYNVLNSLISKGLASYVVKSGVKFFESADPNRIVQIQEEKLNSFKTALPELEKIKQIIGKRPVVEIYEGKEGLKTILETILKMPSKNTLYGYVNYDLFKYLEFYFPNFIKRRVKNGINSKIIQEKNPATEKLRKQGKELLLDIKFSSERFKSNVFIFDNKTALLTFSKENMLGVLIEDESIANTQKQVFDLLWESAK